MQPLDLAAKKKIAVEAAETSNALNIEAVVNAGLEAVQLVEQLQRKLRELDNAAQLERQRHQTAMDDLVNRRIALRATCPHTITKGQADPATGRIEYQCEICGKDDP
jgi:thiamine monophosphate synthase